MTLRPGYYRVACLAVIAAAATTPPQRAKANGPVFICFYEAGQVVPSSRCLRVLLEAAAYWKQLHEGAAIDVSKRQKPPVTLHVALHGFSQDGKSNSEEDSLSEARTTQVAEGLLQLGIPESEITQRGFGDKLPLVPYVNSDPQNRRVEIVMSP